MRELCRVFVIKGDVHMSYDSKNIKEVIEMIGRNEIYLPVIQRKFVWKPEQIENLFDSIM